VKLLSNLIHVIKKVYKFCTFSSIGKDNAATNYVTVERLTFSIPLFLTGHTKLISYTRSRDWKGQNS
jgi:hypothetical protein